MTLPFTIDAPARVPRPVTVTINADPARNLSAFVRLYLRLTQEELAARAGCSFETIQNIERGVTPVSRKMAQRLLGLVPRRARLDWMGIPHRYR